jgi:hypothetical protein
MTDATTDQIKHLEFLVHGEKCLRQSLEETVKIHSQQQNKRIEQLEAALRHYACGCKWNECQVKPKYAPLKCGWPARQALGDE